jgi:hypothetical protein
MTVIRRHGETVAHHNAQTRIVRNHLDDKATDRAVSAARTALVQYGPQDAVGALIAVLTTEAAS